MAYTVPIDAPLTESQAQLISKIGSMKNLAELPFLKKFKIKKGDEISLFDYLLKVLRAMGIDPQILIVAFLNDFFRTEKIVELILNATAQLSTVAKIKLDRSNPFVVPQGNLTTDERKRLKSINYSWLNNSSLKSALHTLVDATKIRIIQELMVLMFGQPKKQSAAVSEGDTNALTYSNDRLNELINESLCGAEIFSISSPINPANLRNEDLEYNRLKKLEQVKNGNLTFQVTCQGVDISLPDDPMYLFRDSPPGFISSNPLSPQEAMDNVLSFVGNQVQKGTSGTNSQSDAKAGEKSFSHKLLETLIVSITCLLRPMFIGITNMVPGATMGVTGEAYTLLSQGILKYLASINPDASQFANDDYVPYSSCEILTQNLDKNNLSNSQKKKICLISILSNLALNMAIGFLLTYVMKEVKKLIAKYIAKRAQEKAKRKLEKIKKKMEVSFIGKQSKKIEKATKQLILIAEVAPALKPLENPLQGTNIT